MIIPNITNETRDNAKRFTETMGAIMSRDKSHQDGLGYAAVDSKGNLFAERWLDNSKAFKVRPSSDGFRQWSGFLKFDYSNYGTVNLDDMTAITLHTRLATSGKGLVNCHPFIENDTSVIHNGVISNAFDFRIEQSTCDSEAILTQYVDNGVGHDPELFDKVSTQLDGYYACGIFSRDSSGKRILDIVKSKSAVLVGAYVNELNTMVFTSLESHLAEGVKSCGFTMGAVFSVEPSSMVRIDPLTGNVLSTNGFIEIDRVYTTSKVKSYDTYSEEYWTRDWYKSDTKAKVDNEAIAEDTKKKPLVSLSPSKVNDPFYYEGEGYSNKSKKARRREARLKSVKQ
jgi:hypothetical protein